MSALTIDRIAGALGAELSGLDLSRPLTEGELGALRAAVVEHKVVFLRDQPYATEHLVRLTEQLGGHGQTPFLGHARSSGRGEGGARGTRGGFNFGGAWHSDWSLTRTTRLHAALVDVPTFGGDTMWATSSSPTRP
jgi:taurine dioxygenase